MGVRYRLRGDLRSVLWTGRRSRAQTGAGTRRTPDRGPDTPSTSPKSDGRHRAGPRARRRVGVGAPTRVKRTSRR